MADGWSTSPTPAAAGWVDKAMDALNLDDAEKQDDAAAAPREVIDPRAGNEAIIKQVAELGWEATTSTADSTTWRANAARYEWNEEYGDVAPHVPELEEVLYGGDNRRTRGDAFDALTEFEVVVTGPKAVKPVLEFSDAGLHPAMIDNIRLCGYQTPTPVQSYCIPLGLQANDLIAVAQTGSGKTAGYLIPVLSRLMGRAKRLAAPRPNAAAPGYDPRLHRVRAEPLVVVVVPTRELAMQIFDEARRLCYRSMLRPCVSYGQLPYTESLQDLGRGCDILIGTPGRLCDLMDRPEVLTMSRRKFTIIDEADELLHADWEEELKKIMSGGDCNLDADHIFMMYSATFPAAALDLASEYLNDDHYEIRIGRPGSTHKNIQQDVIWVEPRQKNDALENYLLDLEPCRVLIFCNSRKTVDNVDDFLYNRGWPTTSIHKDRNQREREDALLAFRSGRAPILIATAVTARGLDIPGIKYVINYDLPDTTYSGIDDYIHRIGRTARIGHKGHAMSFFNEKNEDLGKALTNVLLESGCPVPEFLQEHVHEDGQAHFEEEGAEVQDNNDETNAEEFHETFADAASAAGSAGQEAVPTWG